MNAYRVTMIDPRRLVFQFIGTVPSFGEGMRLVRSDLRPEDLEIGAVAA